jgi:hypothetical protein
MKKYLNTKDNIFLFKKSRYSKKITLIVVIDENGLVYHKKINGFVDQKIYWNFLYELHEKLGLSKIGILFYGLTVKKRHVSWTIILIEFGWIGLLNKANSPK